MNVPETLIRIENHDRSTKVYFAGIEIGQILDGFSFDQSGGNLEKPKVTLTFAVPKLLELLAGISEEDIAKAKGILGPYLEKHKKYAAAQAALYEKL